MRRLPTAVLAPAVLLAVGLLAGCSTATSTEGTAASAATSPATTGQPAATPAARGGTDWTTYHRDAARTGVAPARPAAGPLSIAWRRQLDGAVYGQPLVIGGLVIAATEGDTVYGRDRGAQVHLSLIHISEPTRPY